MYARDTIAAISTPLGEGGIGIVRISGDAAGQVGKSIFRARHDGGFPSHRFCYGEILAPDGDVLDEGYAVFLKGPHSCTREDVFELHCHGGMLVVQCVLDSVLAKGARLAEPGEFTKRAFLNGRIDLLQAEAVMDLIRSKTDTALKLAEHQREGHLSRRLTEVRDGIRQVLALAEAHIDFPEEEIEVAALDGMETDIRGAIATLDRMLSGFQEGKVLRDGVAVAIAGKPNVGKSSLLNTLLRERRAIVTAIPGTTRDVIEVVINIDGLPVRLLDTAGIRETSDEIERIGIELSLDRIRQADLVLFVVDSSRDFDDDDLRILDSLNGVKTILVSNKADLPTRLRFPDQLAQYSPVNISTTTREGVGELRSAICEAFISGKAVDSREYVAISQARHRDALLKGRQALSRALSSVRDSAELELIAVELRESLSAIGEVTGETTPDDVLDLIFSRFCIGK